MCSPQACPALSSQEGQPAIILVGSKEREEIEAEAAWEQCLANRAAREQVPACLPALGYGRNGLTGNEPRMPHGKEVHASKVLGGSAL